MIPLGRKIIYYYDFSLQGIFDEKTDDISVRKKSWTVFLCCVLIMAGLIGRLAYLMCFCSERYYDRAEELHERERDIKATRGLILDARGKVLASNRTVCTVSVIHSQIRDPEKIIRILAEKLGMKEEDVRKRVEKISSIERIKARC